MTGKVRFLLLLCVLPLLSDVCSEALPPDLQAQGRITAPQEFFGFGLGSDSKIARWDKIVEYYRLLEKESGKIKVVDMGPSTKGIPSSSSSSPRPDNLARLESLREVNARLSDPRGLSDRRSAILVGEGKAVICQSMSLHATEIGGTQMAPELAYDLVVPAATRKPSASWTTSSSSWCRRFNPDGAIMVYRLVPEDPGHGISRARTCPGFITSTPATTTTGTPSKPTWSNPNTWPRSCSATGSRRLTSTITTWAATAPGSSSRPTPSPSGLWPIR